MTDRKLTLALRARILAVAEANQEVQRLRRELEAAGNRLKLAVGGRDALASLWLPEGVKLGQAWRNNLDGLREDIEPEPEEVEPRDRRDEARNGRA